MLCPKCGFISFDHFLVCVKCRADLSQVGMELHGTATDVECRPYLRLVLKDPDSEVSPEHQKARSEVFSVAENDQVSGTQNEEDAGGNVGAEERTALPVEDSSGLEFDLEGISLLDLAGSQGGGASVPAAEAVPEVITPPAAISAADQDAPPLVPASAASEEGTGGGETLLEIDTLCLDLQDDVSEEGDSARPESAPVSGGVVPSANLVATLQEIDLSDLVHDGGATGAQDGNEAAIGGLDFEDTMDLSLFIGETEPANASSSLPPERGVEPIDLTLVDDALVDLAVDPSRKEQTASPGEAIAGLDDLLMDDRSEA